MKTAKKAAKNTTAPSIGEAVADAMQQPDHPAAETQLVADIQNHGKADTRRRGRKDKLADLPDVEVPPELIANPASMNYVLLLALLMQHDGVAELTSKQLEVDESQYNIVYSRTLDNKKVVVQIVSAQSGILKSPTGDGKMGEWDSRPTYQEPPQPAGDVTRPVLTREEMLNVAAPMELSPQERFLQAGAAAQAPPVDGAKAANPFPFEIGDRPTNTTTMDLAAYASQQTNRSEQVEADQLRISERVESQGH